MVILVIRRLVWGITNRGSTVNKYIYIFIILLYIYLLYACTRETKFTKFTIY